MCGNGEELNLEDVLWVPGIDYISGWRDAKSACEELSAALAGAWPGVEGIAAVAQSAPDGAAIVQLRLPIGTARVLTQLLRAEAAG